MDRLSNIEDIVEVGWVCVDQRPIKQVLSSLTSKWKHIYASHLERQVILLTTSLASIFKYIVIVLRNVDKEILYKGNLLTIVLF